MLVVTHQTWEHLWYLYALLTIYIALPLWRYILKRSRDAVVLCILGILYFLALVLNSREIALHLFFINGELFRRHSLKLKKRESMMIFISSIIILIITYIHESQIINLNRLLGYTSLFVVIQAYALFSFLYEVKFDKLWHRIGGLFLRLSNNSFGIYLAHMFFVNLEYKVLKIHLMNSLISFVVFIVLITANVAFSYFATCIMKMIPGLRKLL